MDDITNTAETEGLFSKRSSSNILSDPRILEHLRIVAEEAQSSEKNDEDAETELVVNKRELAEKIANYNKRNQGAFRLVLKENLNFEGALRFYFEDDNEKITKAIRLTNKSLVSEILPTLIEKFKPDLDQPSLLRKAKLYEVHDEDDREADEICLDPSDYPLDIALSARRFPRFVLRLEYDKPSKPISPQQNGVAKQEEPRKSSLNSSVASLKSAASDGSSTSGSTQISKDSHHSTPVSSRFSPSKGSTSSGTPTSSRRHPDDRPSSSNSSDRAKNLFKNTHSPRSALGMFFDGVSSGNQDRSAHHAHKAVRVKHQRKRSFGSLLKLKKSVAAKKTVELSTNQLAPGVLKVFGGHVSPGSNYKSVRASEFSSAEVIVKEALERYSLDSSNSNDYVLCDVIGFFSGADGNTKRESQKTRSLEIGKWISEYSRVVGDQEKPLVLQQLWKPISGFSRRFELRKKVETEESSFFRPRGSVAVMKAASEREVQISPAIKETQSPKRIVNSFSHFQSFGTDEGTNSSRPSVILSPFLPPTDTPYLLLLRGYAIAEDHLYHRLDEQIALIGLHSSISGDGNHGDYDENHPDISLFAPDVLPQHCVLCKKVEADGDFDLEEECDVNFVVYLNPNKNATVRINGVPILSPIKLSPGDLISLGVHYVYMFKDPTQVLDNTLQLNWMSTLQKFNEISENVKRNVSETDTINSETSLETTQEYFDGEDKRKLSLIYRVENEDRLVDMVMNMTQDVYELTPSYLLIMCIEHSCQYHTDVQTRGLMVKISNAIQRVALERTTEMSNIIEKHTPPDKAMAELLPQLNPVIFWMANSMEMFHFLRSNISCYVGDALLVGSHGDQSLTNADKELLVCLEEVVMYTFQQTVYHLTKVLYVALPVILDTNPFLFDEDGSNDKQPQEIEMVVNIFNQTYDALLQSSVHNEIVHQLFAYLFFFTNASLFNTLMERGAGGKFYRWAKGAQIRGNLDALEGWASKFELQDEYVHYMTRLSTAADLLATPKVQLLQADWMTIRRDFPALNAAQLQQILSEYQLGPGKSRPRGWFPPPEEVEPALRTADILLSFADYPPLSLPTANFKLDLKNGPSSTLFYDYLDFIKGSSRSGFKNSNWKTYKSSNKEKRHAPEVSSVIEPEEKLRFSAVGSPEDLDEIDAPSDKVSPSTARPQDNERNKHVSHPAAQTDQGHPEKSKGVAVKSHATGSNWREKNTPKHETRKEIPGPLPASASRTPNRNCPDTVLETSHPSGPSWPKSPQSNPRGNIKEDPSEKTHNPRARRRPSPSTTPGAIPPRGRTSGGTTPTESPRDSLRAYHVRSSSGGSSASSLSSFGTRDENQNVPKLTRKESDSYKDDETKWVEINGSEMIESVDGLSVLPENEHAYSDTETSKSKEKHNQVLLSEKVKFMGQLKRNDFHKSDLSGDVETGSGSHRKLEGMRDGNDPQDDVFIVELEKTSSGIGLGLIDGLYTPLRSPGIYVRTLLQGGAAEKDGRLRLGDRILAVNGTSLVGADYQSAMQEIREAGNNLSFLVAKSDIHIAMKITASSC